MRSKNDANFIEQTLAAVTSQDYPGAIKRVHIDSGSTDGTFETISKYGADQLIQIQPEEYMPGRVLNTGMRLTAEDWVVFLNSDATPVGRDWLKNLLTCAVESSQSSIVNRQSSIENRKSRIGAVFGRQVPRPGCRAVFVRDYERCFGPDRESARWPHFFSMASSAVSRAAWLENPFREDIRYAEDDEWSYRIKVNGWEVLFAEHSTVVHSHNYTIEEVRKRTYGEGFTLAVSQPPQPFDPGFVTTVLLAGARDSLQDLAYCGRHGRLLEWPHAVAVRYAQRRGRRAGFLAGRTRKGRV